MQVGGTGGGAVTIGAASQVELTRNENGDVVGAHIIIVPANFSALPVAPASDAQPLSQESEGSADAQPELEPGVEEEAGRVVSVARVSTNEEAGASTGSTSSEPSRKRPRRSSGTAQ